MWTAGNYGERLLLARVLAQLLEAQAEVLEGEVLQGWVEQLRSDAANGSIPGSTSNALMLGALRRRIAARILRGEEPRPAMRARRNQLIALEHGCHDVELFMRVIAMGESAGRHLDGEPRELAPQCFCEVARDDIEQLDRLLRYAQAALAQHQRDKGEDESYQRTLEALERLGSELARPMRPRQDEGEPERPCE